jgi:hypothetical protein
MDATRERLPAVLLLAVGVGLVVWAGSHVWWLTVGFPGPEIEVSTQSGGEAWWLSGERVDGVGVFRYGALSERERQVVDRALGTASNATTVDGGATSLEHLSGDRLQYAFRDGLLYAVTPSGEGTRYAVERVRGLPDRIREIEGVYAVDSLTEREQRVIDRALDAPDGSATTRGSLGTLHGAGDAPDLGNGRYLVYRDGVSHGLTVSSPQGFFGPQGALVVWVPAVLAGLLTAYVGWSSLGGPRVRVPVTLLAGHAVLLVPVVLFRFGLLDSPPTSSWLWWGRWLLLAPVAAAATYVTLWLLDGEDGAVATRSE